MSVMVSLRDVVNEMAEVSDDQTAFLNRRTGELISLNDEQRYVLENGRADDAPDGQRELREVLQAGDLLELPSAFEHHEYSIVERFCHTVKDAEQQDQLLTAIRGKRAFRDFKAAIITFGLADAWRHYRDHAFEAIAADWLAQNDIAYDKAA
ncbi:MAG: UPF0158 family protein [Planctomycetota bacterium]|jgi:hypothetical protein